jgi:hypothetical protein
MQAAILHVAYNTVDVLCELFGVCCMVHSKDVSKINLCSACSKLCAVLYRNNLLGCMFHILHVKYSTWSIWNNKYTICVLHARHDGVH